MRNHLPRNLITLLSFIPMTPGQLAAFQKAELAKWAKTIKDANIKGD